MRKTAEERLWEWLLSKEIEGHVDSDEWGLYLTPREAFEYVLRNFSPRRPKKAKKKV